MECKYTHRQQLGDHVSGSVPGQTAQRQFVANLVLHGPLREVHNVRGLIDANNAVGGGGGQQESQVLGCKLHIRDTGPRVYKGGAAHPAASGGIGGGYLFANHLLPNGGGAIK